MTDFTDDELRAKAAILKADADNLKRLVATEPSAQFMVVEAAEKYREIREELQRRRDAEGSVADALALLDEPLEPKVVSGRLYAPPASVGGMQLIVTKEAESTAVDPTSPVATDNRRSFSALAEQGEENGDPQCQPLTAEDRAALAEMPEIDPATVAKMAAGMTAGNLPTSRVR